MADDNSIILGLVFFWVICGVVAAVIANARGANAVAGFFIGLFFGPIGLVVACLLPSSAPLMVAEIGMGPQKRCPDCAELVHQDARICRHCRHEFSSGT